MSTFSRRCTGEHRTMPRALDALWMAWADPMVTVLGWLTGLRSSESLWPWAAMRPREIVKFSNFSWIYSDVSQIQFGLNWNSSKFVQIGSLNEFSSSQCIQIGEYQLGLQIQLNLIKPLWKILIIV
jgi:hypothetical protein